MEQKKNNIFMPLLLNALNAKRNWFFLSTIIVFVTTLLIPYILGADEEFFIFFGIVEIFILVFVNCLVDNSFFHNDSKLAYYKSKPATFKEQTSVNIIINLIFAGYLMLLIALSVGFQDLDYRILESFKFLIPWLMVGIFLASLSSILAGNTLVAGAMTIFNFALPGILFIIVQFMFSILENLVAGFSSSVLMDYFVNKVYKLEYIYFVKYSEIPLDFVYFLILGIILFGITLLIFKMLKRRKNENTGNFIVFDGYKYFVSVLACIIVPAFFELATYNRNITNAIIVSLIMAALTYYIIIAIIEKSFKSSKLSIKVFIISMTVFIAATGVTIAFANQYKNVIPVAEDVKMAYVGSNRWAIQEVNDYLEKEGQLDLEGLIELQNRYSITLFTEKENIETIIELHEELLNNQSYGTNYWMNGIVITYFMNDGSYLIRDYNINLSKEYSSGSEKKDELASKLLSSQEFKKRKYYYLYDEDNYLNNYNNIDIFIGRDGIGGNAVSNIPSLEEIRPYLIKDIDGSFLEIEDAFLALQNYNYELPYRDNKGSGYYLQIIVRDNTVKDAYLKENIQSFYLDDGRFENTREYLEPFIMKNKNVELKK